MSELVHIDGKDHFKTEVIDFKGVVIVDFYADRCGPCKMLGPIMEELQADNVDKAVKIVKIDTDTNQDLAMKFEVTGIPSVFVIKDGETKANMVGVQPKDMYQTKIDEYLASA